MNEIAHFEAWSIEHNLKLNTAKLKEMIIKSREKCNLSAQLPPPCTDTEPVTTTKVLGVIIIIKTKTGFSFSSLYKPPF